MDPDAPLRQPIVAVLGHVDHGKTSLLDYVRGTAVVKREAGAITQHIGATEVPYDTVSKICGPLLKDGTTNLPGLLFIDTPGHHSFSTLRSRGGALADIAVLVVDITEGFKPQTIESINILKQHKTPFILALNKIDKLPGWRTKSGSFLANKAHQSQMVQQTFQTRMYEIIGELGTHGFDSALFTDIQDFQKTIALIPTSVKDTGEGVPELFMILMGLAQKYLRGRLLLSEGSSEGTVLEIKEEKGLGKTLGVIIYNGILKASDTLIIGAQPEPIVTRVRSLLRPKPLDEIRDPRQQFDSVKVIGAAAGLKVVAPDIDGVVAGAPFYSASSEDEVDDALDRLTDSMKSNVKCTDEGVVIRADAIGSLEALAYELSAVNIPIVKAVVGDVSRRDVVTADPSDEEYRAILAFNVKVHPDAKKELHETGVKIFESDIVYRLLEDYQEWKDKIKDKQAQHLREDFSHPGKFEILEGHTFRTRDPAVVGVRVLGGRIALNQAVLRNDNSVVGHIRSLRSGDQVLKEALQGDEVAIAISDATVGRQISEGDVLYIEMDERAILTIREAGVKLDPIEEDIITEMQKIKKKDQPFWAR
ncbi:MAG: translation initiation factor IF-2 [Marine Group III euryarchaeote CG-Epi3]|uniref:Probable translation initiation factor IF-2 n=1 Tax=Marine Group III euryarchaeote CG-Epi3 TaxID=1888997 RepID=A0A1J5UA99_9ARCH|nr:MAG: translation initiation factor IF-2 [Marine Group III euryarchaeote CG-Epi3]